MNPNFGVKVGKHGKTGLLSNQGEKSINFYFIRVPLRKSIKVWYSKAQKINLPTADIENPLPRERRSWMMQLHCSLLSMRTPKRKAMILHTLGVEVDTGSKTGD